MTYPIGDRYTDPLDPAPGPCVVCGSQTPESDECVCPRCGVECCSEECLDEHQHDEHGEPWPSDKVIEARRAERRAQWDRMLEGMRL